MKVMHKFYRKIISGAQFRVCDNKRCDFAENVSYQWKKVSCAKCKEKRPKDIKKA